MTAAGRGPHIVSLLSRIDRTGISLRSREEAIAFTGQGILALLTFRVRVANMVGIVWSKWGLIQEEMLCVYGVGLGGMRRRGVGKILLSQVLRELAEASHFLI